jgi:hypothetical protein
MHLKILLISRCLELSNSKPGHRVSDLYFFSSLLNRYDQWLSDIKQTPNHLSLDRSPNIGGHISCVEPDTFKNRWNKNFRTSKILTLLYQQFSDLLISQLDMNGPRLWALSNNRWYGGRGVNSHEYFFFQFLMLSFWFAQTGSWERPELI